MTATRFVDLPAGHPGRRLLSGQTPWFATQADRRFPYSLYVPPDLRDDEPPLRLWVFVHGTGRRTQLYLDGFADLARQHRAVVLTPLFPVGIDGPDDVDNYKKIESGGVRYDELLLSMVDEVGHRWPVDTSRFFLHGFSGGGQFANRFVQLHPDRLTAVSIGAPGRIVLPTETAPVPVQVVVGSLDEDASDVRAVTGDPDAPGRVTQAGRLTDAYRELGSDVRLEVVDGVAHEGDRVVHVVTEFLREQLTGR
jgi:poly(3-hydroxybutyrate) depolymerase